MDSGTQPLLADADLGPVPVDRSDAGRSQPHHFCAHCSSHLESQDYRRFNSWTHRHSLITAAIVLCCIMFALSVAEMCTVRRFTSPSVLQVFVSLWLYVTVSLLAVLLFMGRRQESSPMLGRTIVQIRVLCALACSWIIFMIAMATQNGTACERYSAFSRWGWASDATCGLFTTVHVLSWFLFLILFAAAYATYRRAVTIHGAVLVPVPAPTPLVPAWQLANIADGQGAIKI
ncbi:hypothetical protein C8R44DRAFT_790795 [Mycena epipterygia]|nr:hypothetical protein C8R44DRAFT_790795 [Mycena epipterygia]